MKKIEVEKENEQKVLVTREVPENVLSMYLGTGWKLKSKDNKQDKNEKSFSNPPKE